MTKQVWQSGNTPPAKAGSYAVIWQEGHSAVRGKYWTQAEGNEWIEWSDMLDARHDTPHLWAELVIPDPPEPEPEKPLYQRVATDLGKA